MRRIPDSIDPNGEATLMIPQSRAEKRALEVTLRVTGADATPSSLRLAGGTCIIGSAPTCDIVVSDPTVSRTHAELEISADGVCVRDLGSTNGTSYLGHRVQQIVLSFGGVVSLGAVTVVIEPNTDTFADALQFEGDAYCGMVGPSPAMRRIFAILARLGSSLVPVLIQGESGVGKELIARAIHDGSSVASGQLVVLNCGAIPRDLIASELYGHKKGAFTGAHETRKGAFENADNGTLFLDEVGELPLDMQPVLLRALESGEVRPVGGDTSRRVKVRVVAATNRDLWREVKEGKFREDLYYRLAVIRLDVPPLRERVEDIEPLAQSFARAAGLEELPASVIERLLSRRWDGNVRELRNVVQAYAALGLMLEHDHQKSAMLDVALSQHVDLKRSYLEQKEALTDHFTRIYLKALLERTSGNKSAAARIAGLDRTYMIRLLAKHGHDK